MTRKYADDYQLTYIESLVQALAIRGLWVWPMDVLIALCEIERRGIEGADAETTLRAFFLRLAPTLNDPEPVQFVGWKTWAASVAGATPEELVNRYGSDAARVAVAMREASS